MTTELEKMAAHISPTLALRAVVLSDLPAWTAEDALAVITELSHANCIVLGVELWLEEDGCPRWLETTSYSYHDVLDFNERIKLSCEAAKDFVFTGPALVQYHHYIGRTPLYHFTWDEEEKPEP